MTQLDPELRTKIVREALHRGERIKRRRRVLGVSFGAAGAAATAVIVGLALSPTPFPRSTVLVNPSTHTTPTAATSTGPSTPVPSTCQASDLTSTVLQVGAATGHVLVRVALTAPRGVSCDLNGYAQLTPLDAQGQLVSVKNAFGRAAVLSSTPLTPGHANYIISQPPAPRTVHIAPGAPAHFDVTYDDNPTGTQTSCPNITELRIKLPGNNHPIVVKAAPSLGSVCDSFQVTAVVPGSGSGSALATSP